MREQIVDILLVLAPVLATAISGMIVRLLKEKHIEVREDRVRKVVDNVLTLALAAGDRKIKEAGTPAARTTAKVAAHAAATEAVSVAVSKLPIPKSMDFLKESASVDKLIHHGVAARKK